MLLLICLENTRLPPERELAFVVLIMRRQLVENMGRAEVSLI